MQVRPCRELDLHALSEQERQGNIWLTTRETQGKVVITVKDDGPGINIKVRHRLFDPFVTTKTTGQGTGLGLSICHGIVKRYDGEIRVTSQKEGGAEFKVIFPAHNPMSKNKSGVFKALDEKKPS